MCEQSKLNKLICKYKEHSDIQQYLHSSYNPELGKRNLTLYAQHKKQNKMPKSQSNSLTCKIMTTNTTINGAPIGCTSCMSETITVQDPDGNPI